MRYRALLLGNEGAERASQCFSNDLDKLDDWARNELRRSTRGTVVKFYELVEVSAGTLIKDDVLAKDKADIALGLRLKGMARE
jgi:hypothetical protein